MSTSYDYFVVFAEMRTGSNFLEANINAFGDLRSHGEAFNPAFIGYPNKDDLLGVDEKKREVDPWSVIKAIKADNTALGGFRYFKDHDPRVLNTILDDPRCAKIILTRNPAESYVSLKIARETNQWKLTNVKKRKASSIEFDVSEFESHLSEIQEFQVLLLNSLQRSGQTAFYVAYEDLQDVQVMNGLGRFLGSKVQLSELDTSLKKQNPSGMSEKVENFEEMKKALASIDRFNLARTPNFEPRRGAGVPSFVACENVPIIYMPMRSGPDDQVLQWMHELDPDAENGLIGGFSQKTIRQWKREHKGSRSFTVLRHPVARAYAAFCDKILTTDPDAFVEIRRRLQKNFGLTLPDNIDDKSYDLKAHQSAFLQFLVFLKLNLSGQTGIRIDPHWATQFSILQGMSQFMLPDIIAREDSLQRDLNTLTVAVGLTDTALSEAIPHQPYNLGQIYNEDIENAARDVYQRDYVSFGFKDWRD